MSLMFTFRNIKHPSFNKWIKDIVSQQEYDIIYEPRSLH